MNKAIVRYLLITYLVTWSICLDKEWVVMTLSIGFVGLAIYLLRKYGTMNLSDTPRIRNIFPIQKTIVPIVIPAGT